MGGIVTYREVSTFLCNVAAMCDMMLLERLVWGANIDLGASIAAEAHAEIWRRSAPNHAARELFSLKCQTPILAHMGILMLSNNISPIKNVFCC